MEFSLTIQLPSVVGTVEPAHKPHKPARRLVFKPDTDMKEIEEFCAERHRIVLEDKGRAMDLFVEYADKHEEIALFREKCKEAGFIITTFHENTGVNYIDYAMCVDAYAADFDRYETVEEKFNHYFTYYAVPHYYLAEYKDLEKRKLLHKIFLKYKLRWSHSRFILYKRWKETANHPPGLNRYQIMEAFVKQHRSLFI